MAAVWAAGPHQHTEAGQLAASKSWTYQQHSLSLHEDKLAASMFETVIADSGIQAGAGSDSAQISPLNPWLNIFYMVTGRNSSGVLINAGQTLSRVEALRMYTAANGWFCKEEGALGSVEVGKLADLVVLSGHYSIRTPSATTP